MDSYTVKDLHKLLKVKAKANSKGDLKDLASCCNVLGELFQQQGKYEDAILEHEEERDICNKMNDTIGIAIAHRKIGEALNELGKYESAIKHQHKYLALAKSVDNKLEVQRALATIGRTHFCHAEALTTNNRVLYDQSLSSSKEYYEKSLKLSERLKGEVSERDYMQMNSRLYLNLGLVCDLQSQDSAAINFFKKTIYMAGKYQLREDLHRCHYSLALFYQRRKNYSQAKREAEMAEKVAIQLKDKALICDDLALKAQLFVIMADFESARRYLIKAYKQKSPVASDRERIEIDLKSVVRLCKLQDLCCAVPSGEEDKLIRLHEKMGDLCSSLKAYPRAIDFYMKMLTKAQEHGWPATDINPIYVSLSQTYMDLKDYKKAIVYYEKELEHYAHNPSESCRTMLNIANALEEDGATYYELQPLYDKALNLAIEAGNPRLKANTINSLAVLHETNGEHEKSKRAMAEVQEICSEHSIDLDDESEPSSSQATRAEILDEEEEINLQDLIDDDSDEEEAVPGNARGKRQPKKNIEKLNMKGETALHRACIKQDINLVRMLLQQKHKVNVRDNCGWTPLHEACNYGNVEIVELLIEHGAAVNDRGGKLCDGVTPLHDAASCGHIDVMAALLKNGANPLVQTNLGESVYECLLKWRLRTCGDLDSRSLKDCTDMEQKLVEAMKKANQKVPSLREVDQKQSQSTSALIPEEEHTEDEVTLTHFSDVEEENFKPRESISMRKSASTTAQREYAAAMKVIGSSSIRRSGGNIVGPSKRSRNQPALLLEDEIEDNWLENDVRSPVKKSSKKSSSTRTSSEFDSERTPTASSSRLKSSSSHRSKSSSLTPLSLQNISLSDDDDYFSEEVPPSAKRTKKSPTLYNLSDESSNDRVASPVIGGPKRAQRPVQLSMDAFTVSDSRTSSKKTPVQHQPAQPTMQSPGILKLYVRIQGKVLLIPVGADKTVKWLTEEAARRFYNMTGLSPILSLQTDDGAALNEEDVVNLILRDGDKVVGEMVKWDLQPLPERYGNLCRQLEIARLGEVDSLLTNSHTSGKLSLGLPLGSYILPVLKALRYQESLWDLDLSSTRLDDNLFQTLCEALSTLPHLVNLDLHSNLITASGISRLAETVRTENVTGLKKLQKLVLSFNPLGDGASYPLNSCLQHTTALRILHLESCDLTDRFLDDHISPTLRRKKLEEVAIGWNEWSPAAVRTWLELLDLSSLKRFSLVAPTAERVINSVASCIQCTEDCQLVELDLSHCNMTEFCVDQLTQVFDKLPRFKKLILKNNPRLGVNALTKLLTGCLAKHIHLEELNFLGCPLVRRTGAEPDVCLESLESLLAWSKSLKKLSISFGRQSNDPAWVNAWADIWIAAHGHDAIAEQPTTRQLLLTFSHL